MRKHGQLHQQSRKMALCGIITALSAVILTWGSLIPFSTFTCPMLAIAGAVPVVCEYGMGTSLLLYTSVSILGLLLCPDKEIALFFVSLGWYPGVQPRLNTLPHLLDVVIKCALFSLSMTMMYSLILYLFQLEAVMEEFSYYSTAMVIGMLVLGNVTFLLYDRVLSNLSMLYRRKRKL